MSALCPLSLCFSSPSLRNLPNPLPAAQPLCGSTACARGGRTVSELCEHRRAAGLRKPQAGDLESWQPPLGRPGGGGVDRPQSSTAGGSHYYALRVAELIGTAFGKLDDVILPFFAGAIEFGPCCIKFRFCLPYLALESRKWLLIPINGDGWLGVWESIRLGCLAPGDNLALAEIRKIVVAVTCFVKAKRHISCLQITLGPTAIR